MINKHLNVFKIDLFLSPLKPGWNSFSLPSMATLSFSCLDQKSLDSLIYFMPTSECSENRSGSMKTYQGPNHVSPPLVLAPWSKLPSLPTWIILILPQLVYRLLYLVLLTSVFSSTPGVILLRRKAEHATLLLKTFTWTFTLESKPKSLSRYKTLWCTLSLHEFIS